jgi:VIT1/CCC1 family predicted Fe2+/Mn2+ transporter
VKFNIQLGAGAIACAVCLFISYVAFQDGNAGLGWLFLLVGFAIAVLGFVLGDKDGSKFE